MAPSTKIVNVSKDQKETKMKQKTMPSTGRSMKWLTRATLSTGAIMMAVAPNSCNQCSAFSLAVAPTLTRTDSTPTTQSTEAAVWRKSRLEQPPSWTTFQEAVVATNRKYMDTKKRGITRKQNQKRQKKREITKQPVSTTSVPAAFSRLFFHTQESIRPLSEIANLTAHAQIQSQRLRRLVVSLWKIFQEGLQRQDEAMESLQQDVDTLKANLEQALQVEHILRTSTPQENFQYTWNLAGNAVVDFGLTETTGLHFRMAGNEVLLADVPSRN